MIAEGKTTAEIVRFTGLTRERVRQLRTETYAKEFVVEPDPITLEYYNSLSNIRCELRINCEGTRVHRASIHFVSYEKTPTPETTFLACTACLYKLGELNRPEKQLTKYQCEICKKESVEKHGYLFYRKGVQYYRCDACILAGREERKKFWCYKYRLMGCKECGTNKRKHSRNGLCIRCFSRLRYKTDPTFRARVKEASLYYQKYGRKTRPKDRPLWNKKYNLIGCRACYSSSRKHAGKGFCVNCYQSIVRIQKQYGESSTRPDAVSPMQK